LQVSLKGRSPDLEIASLGKSLPVLMLSSWVISSSIVPPNAQHLIYREKYKSQEMTRMASSLPLNEDEPHEMKTAWESRSRVGSFDQMLVKSGVE